VIFLTLGTQLPFDRLVRAVDAWCAAAPGREVFGQIVDPGATGYRPQHMEWVSHLSPEDYRARFEDASLIIAHAGMGTIITAMSMGKPLVLMPRKAGLGEHRNDHQVATVERFGTRQGIHVASDETTLPGVLDCLEKGAGQAPTQVSPYAEPSLIEKLYTEIHAPRRKR
jgi:exopolysaccharide biosynthesis glucuronosyltransferase PssE